MTYLDKPIEPGPIRMTSDVRKAAFYAGLLAVDLRGNLPVALIEVLKPGDDFYSSFPDSGETLTVSVQRQRVERMLDRGQAYHGAVDAGLISPGASFDAFLMREVVTVYSEFHGGHSFAYDVGTGTRFLPRGDVDHLHAGLGSTQVALGNMLDALLENQKLG